MGAGRGRRGRRGLTGSRPPRGRAGRRPARPGRPRPTPGTRRRRARRTRRTQITPPSARTRAFCIPACVRAYLVSRSLSACISARVACPRARIARPCALHQSTPPPAARPHVSARRAPPVQGPRSCARAAPSCAADSRASTAGRLAVRADGGAVRGVSLTSPRRQCRTRPGPLPGFAKTQAWPVWSWRR